MEGLPFLTGIDLSSTLGRLKYKVTIIQIWLCSHFDLILESNTCVLSASSALSSRVFPARNHILVHHTNSRNLTPTARFILPGAVIHWDGQPGAAGSCVPRVPGIVSS